MATSGLTAEQVLAARRRGNSTSGMGSLDPIEINGVLYDPITMQPI